MGRVRRVRRPIIVWVPVLTNVALVALAALLDDATAVALTSVGAVVVTGAVIVHLRESDADKERIQHLQDAIPTLGTGFDAGAALTMVPKPSPVMTEVLKQAAPAALSDPAPLPIAPTGEPRGISRS